MMYKAVLLCASALMVQSTSVQRSCGYSSGGYSGSLGSSSAGVSTSGGDLIVTSVGPITPSGISVSSELGLSGDLDICGALPFLSAVEFQTQLPTCGSGCVDYSCGSCGNVAITSVSGGGSLSNLGGCGCGKY